MRQSLALPCQVCETKRQDIGTAAEESLASVNKAIVVGNLAANPVKRDGQSGALSCHFVLAVPDSWRDKQGQIQERLEWVRVSVWGKQAEYCAAHLEKGRQVYVEGRLRSTQGQKDGKTVTYTEVVALNVQSMGARDWGMFARDERDADNAARQEGR